MAKRIVIASGNAGKLREFGSLFAPTGFSVIGQSDLQVIEAEENGLTFIENALIKARNACAQTGLIAVSDDSGLEVDCLQGQPGIYSARYAGLPSDDQLNRALLLQSLIDVPLEQRRARFRCVVVFMRHEKDPAPLICQGRWDGKIALAESGLNGFGYDALFLPDGFGCSAAELSAVEKNTVSHRGQALVKLNQALKQSDWLLS